MYEKSVGRNATLIVGLTPDPDGLLPEGDVRRLEEWGEEIQRRTPVASASGRGGTFLLEFPQQSAGDRQSSATSGAVSVDRCVIQEDIAQGERIRSFRVEVRMPDSQWQTVYTGTSVGHKHIAVFDRPVTATAVRLVVDSSRAVPCISRYPALQ